MRRFGYSVIAILMGATTASGVGCEGSDIPDDIGDGGATSSSSSTGTGDCTPITCLEAGKNCDTIDDGCGQQIECGTCNGMAECGAAGTPGVCSLAPADRICGASGFCWENPLPHGNVITGLWAAAPNDVWAVGGGGVIQHWDGAKWTHVPSGTDMWLGGVFGAAPNDIWAAGLGVMTHWDGTQWTAESFDTGPFGINEVWQSEGTFFVAGAWGTYRKLPGGTWQVLSNTGSDAIFGTSPTDVWVVKSKTHYHFDGTNLVEQPPLDPDGSSPASATGWARAADDAWIGGHERIFHFDGSTWTADNYGDETSFLSAAIGVGEDIWMGGSGGILRNNKTSGWSTLPPSDVNVRSLAATGPSDLWAGGTWGDLAHFDGKAFTSFKHTLPGNFLSAVWASGPDDVWAAGIDVLHGRADGSWVEVPSSLIGVNTIWGFGPSDIWFGAGSGVIAHGDGKEIAYVSSPFEGIHNDVNGIWGASPADVWAVTSVTFETNMAAILHFDGAGWTIAEPNVPNLNAIGGTSADEVYAAGEGVLMKWNGTDWTTIADAPSTFTSLDVIAPGVVLLGTSGGFIYRHDASGLTVEMDEKQTQYAGITSIAGTTEIYATSGSGDVYQRNQGGTWSRIDAANSTSLKGSFTLGSHVWLVGDGTAILHKSK